jgi:hypothetical protein
MPRNFIYNIVSKILSHHYGNNEGTILTLLIIYFSDAFTSSKEVPILKQFCKIKLSIKPI